MKQVIKISLIMVIALSSMYANTADSLDVRQMVQKQFEEAKAKQNRGMSESTVLSALSEDATSNASSEMKSNASSEMKSDVSNEVKSDASSEMKSIASSEVISNEKVLEQTKIVESDNSEMSYTIYKIMFLLFASVLVSAYVYYNRRKKENFEKSIQLKKNIQMMRQEKFIKRIDPRLKQIRTQLCLNATQLQGISSAAKKLNIGKEELALASRIKQYESNYNYNRSAV